MVEKEEALHRPVEPVVHHNCSTEARLEKMRLQHSKTGT
jgi:hypothetical protein